MLLYNLRSVRMRRWNTVAVVVGVGLVVGVFCYLQAFADGLRRCLTVNADPRNLIILAEGATAESNSAVTHAEAERLTALPQVAVDQRGRPLVSPEVIVQTNVTRRGDRSGVFAGVAVRGVDLVPALQVHPAVELVAGRWFQPGANELVAGAAASRQFMNLSVGARVDCGDRTFEIVGVFRADGGAHESELWGYLPNVSDAYRRTMYSCAVVRLAGDDEARVRDAAARVALASVALKAVREGTYYAGQSENARVVRDLGLLIVAIMGVGAVFAATNTLHSALIGRVHELGMLQAIGFSRRALIAGLVTEATLVALCGGVFGCAAAALVTLADGGTRDLVGTTTFTSVAFQMRIRAVHVAWSLAIAAAVGVLGGIWPARRAAQAGVAATLRGA